MQNDVEAMIVEIERAIKDEPYSQENCVNRAASFDMKDKFVQYVKVYEKR